MRSSWFDEWPTLVVLAGAYAVWAAVIAAYPLLGVWWPLAALLIAAPATTLHSSLQHEATHDHPTRNPLINELLVFPGLMLWLPYRRYRESHLKHHNDGDLTCPKSDPESWYRSVQSWVSMSPLWRGLLQMNNSWAGRMTIGVPIAVVGFLVKELQAIREHPGKVLLAWALHLVGLLPVLWWLARFEVPPAQYVLFVAFPATSLLLNRSFIEHRAHACPYRRSAIVEAGPLWSLLYLNNNLHAVHHRFVHLPWYELPARWQQDRYEILARNGGYHYPAGYSSVIRKWLLTPREPVVHPLWSSHDRSD